MSAPVAQASLLAESFAFCEKITRAQAKNFYYALKLVPGVKRSEMYALYAWMRLADDIADESDGRPVGERLARLHAWQTRTHAALDGQLSDDPDQLVWPALSEIVRRHVIPRSVFDDAIEGQRQDLMGVRFRTFEQLREYCRQVAGTVGVASIHIWGFQGGQDTVQLAVDRGVAFQLTNILRDLREDLSRGRIYLPADELAQTELSDDDLLRGTETEQFVRMMRFQIERAEEYYAKSAGLEARIDAPCRPALQAMTAIYHGLLKRIAADPGVVLRGRVRISWLTKLWIGWTAMRGR